MSCCKNRQKQPFMDTSVASGAWNCGATLKRSLAAGICLSVTAVLSAPRCIGPSKKDVRTCSQLHFLLLFFLIL